MKYIFIDTNNYIYSAVSSQKEHKIESYESIKEVIKKGKAVLLIPEINKIEFYRRIDDVYTSVKNYFQSLKETIVQSKLPPYIAGDKQLLLNAFGDILKEKEKKYKSVLKETEELFAMEGNRYIRLNTDIFIRAYVRCLKGEKPFKTKDAINLEGVDDFSKNVSWLSDAIVAESIISECVSMSEREDVLVFCSNNIHDFADNDKKTNRHILHKHIKRDIKPEVVYYRFIPEMLEYEFSKRITKEEKKAMEDTQKYYEETLRRGAIKRAFEELAAGGAVKAGLRELASRGEAMKGVLAEMAAGGVVRAGLRELASREELMQGALAEMAAGGAVRAGLRELASREELMQGAIKDLSDLENISKKERPHKK
jgi:hypothetical protein